MTDKNFDKLVKKFAKNIYGTPKGKIRSAVLMRDLTEALSLFGDQKLRILDAGGGFGHISQQLATLGHQVVLCDISSEMLELARQQIAASEQALDIELVNCALQELTLEAHGQFDLILCHAVVEWLADAQSSVTDLLKLLKPNGLFSLMFYNREAQRFHNLVSGNFDFVTAGMKVKKQVKLTPQYPVYVEQVQAWFKAWQLRLICQSGVRVIHDYMNSVDIERNSLQDLIEMELQHSRKTAYIPLGRYVHFIGQS